jgi:hypothetical protein
MNTESGFKGKRHLVAWIGLALAAGCGGANPAAIDERTQALGSDGGVASASCELNTGVSPVCAGPWRYTQFNEPCKIDFKPDPSCGEQAGYPIPAHTIYPNCTLVSLGDSGVFTKTLETTSNSICTKWSPPQPCTDDGCPDPWCMNWKVVYTAVGTCTQVANQQVAAVNGWAHPSFPADHPGVPASYPAPYFDNLQSSGVGTASPKCTFVIRNYPSFAKVDNDFRCGLGTNYPIEHRYLTCNVERLHGCGLTAMYAPGNSTGTTLDAIRNNSDVGQQPTCTTCDDLPIGKHDDTGAAALVQSKASCLLNTVFPNLSNPELSSVLNTNVVSLKLLFETRGDQLSVSADQIKAIEALYTTQPAVVPGCGEVWTPLQPSQDCQNALPGSGLTSASLATLNNDMAVCLRLADPHSAEAVRALYLQRCIYDLPATIQKLPPSCDRATYQTKYDSLSTNWLILSLSHAPFDFSNLDTNRTNTMLQLLRGELREIGKWYAAQRALFAGNNLAQLDADLSKVLGAFWTGVHSGSGAALTKLSATGTAQALTDRNAIDMAGNRLVLLALLNNDPSLTPPAPPLTSGPMVSILGDAIEPLLQRLTQVILIHDVGCRYQGCAVTGSADEVSDLWELLSAVASKTDLTTLTGKFANNTSFVQADWQAVFNALTNSHEALESAVLDYYPGRTYTPSLLLQTTSKSPEPVLHLSRLIIDAQTRTANFKKTGALSGRRGDVLTQGIQKTQQDATSGRFSQALQTLDLELNDYDRKRATLVSGVLAQVGNAGNLRAIADRVNAKVDAYNDLEARATALKHNSDVDDARLGDFIAGWKTRSDQADLNAPYQAKTYQSLRVRPLYARFNGRPIQSIIEAALQPKSSDLPVDPNGNLKLLLKKGEMLHVSIDQGATWSPTCALNNNAWTAPFTNGVDTTSFAGPEGYVLTKSNSKFAAGQHQQTHSSDSYTTSDFTGSICLTSKVGFGQGAAGAFGVIAEVAVTASGCASGSTGDRTSDSAADSASTGDESRTSAAFSTGLRVPNSPFPYMPVGSLLLVAMPHDVFDPRVALRVQVLHAGNTGFTAERDADVYLVVNDLGVCGEATGQDKGGFDVTVSQVTPLSLAVKDMGAAMADQLAAVRAKLPSYVSAGAFLPSERAQLSSDAISNLHAAVGATVTIPQEMLSLFTTRLDYELVRIERAVQILDLQRQQRAIALEMTELSDEIGNAKEQSRLLELVPMWTLQRLDDTGLLTADSAAVARTLSEDLYPIIRIRYHELFNTDNNSGLFANGHLLPSLKALVNANWRDELYDQARALQTAAVDVKRIFDDAVSHDKPASTPVVIVRFPRPEFYKSCLNNPAFCPLANTFRQVDIESASRLWEDLDATGKANFAVRPENVYFRGGGNAILACESDLSAVVRSAIVFFNQGNDPAQYGSLNGAPLKAIGDLEFETEAGSEKFTMDNPNWLLGNAQLLFDQASNLEADLRNVLTNPLVHLGFGEGISPFTTFNIDLSGYRTQTPGLQRPLLSNMDEMIVVFMTETRTVSSGARGVASCWAPPPPPTH